MVDAVFFNRSFEVAKNVIRETIRTGTSFRLDIAYNTFFTNKELKKKTENSKPKA